MNNIPKSPTLFTTALSLLASIVLQASTVNAFENSAESALVAKAAALAPYQTRSIQDEVFYFVLPDRFYNGDPSNDLGAKASDKKRALSHGGLDVTHKGMYHGGDLAGLTEKLAYLDNMGVSAIWLTPVLRNQAMQADTSGYHGYWILDFTEIDPHLGTNAELKNFIDLAHQRNIKVFFDIITNHTADVIKYEECHGSDGLAWLVKGDSCPFKSLAQLAKGDKYTPLIPAGNEQLKSPLWLNDINAYHNQGDSHWQGESSLRGDFSGLDDINTDDDAVVSGMIQIYTDIIDEFKPDGFRIDTVKHVNMEFWQQFSPALVAHANKQGIENFFMFGEVYSFEPEFLSQFTTKGKIQSVLDFAFQQTMQQTLVDQLGTDKLAALFAQDHHYKTTNKNSSKDANQLVNFTGNHDMGRFAYALRASQFNYDENEQIQRNLLANAMMFFSRGIPVIYYGDEQGFVGDGGDQASRQDMMPSKVASYNDDNLLATTKTTANDNFDVNHPFYRQFAQLSELYQQYPALRFGQQQTLYSQNKPGIFAISREVKGQKLVIVFNTANEAQALTFKSINDKNRLVYQSIKSSDNGKIAPLSFAIYQ
ncbi:MAG: alpha-amylase family glycosyl hydrolase [Colwellia sp.]|nr:alpha-amylase family glycosyl hydrolase [Colwellia sp.]